MGNIQMKKETLYLDTSVPSAYFDDRTKERQEATIKFWREVLPLYQVYISGITVEELEATKNEFLRRNFKKLVKGFRILKVNKKIRNLTRIYIEKGIFPERYIDDALHVATASFYKVSYLVSWNFEHLVKVRTRRLVNSVNVLEGFSEIEIVSPQEL
jgi:predicted nucleic acid-binding protein